MVTALPPRFSLAPSRKWSIYAGFYLFICGVATAVAFSDILSLFADVIGLPAPFAMAIFASPALVIGTGMWWAVVERRGSYSYRRSGLVGLVTALLTGLLWTIRFVSAWGLEMATVPIITVLIALVLGGAGIAGTLTGLPLMYARRRHLSQLTGRTKHPH